MIGVLGGSVMWEMSDERKAIPTCTLGQYQAFLRGTPRPTASQIEAYIQYVASAHSWYKHLPFFPPGHLFHFFLDPTAGCDRLVRADGRIFVRDRTPSTPSHHYNWRTTEFYRHHFGHLAYVAGPRLPEVGAVGDEVADYASLPCIYPTEGKHRVPGVVALAGAVECTAAIHPTRKGMQLAVDIYEAFGMSPASPPHPYWEPHEGDFPGVARLRQLYEPSLGRDVEPGYEKEALRELNAERARQYQEAGEAIRRVLDLVYGAAPAGNHPVTAT